MAKPGLRRLSMQSSQHDGAFLACILPRWLRHARWAAMPRSAFLALHGGPLTRAADRGGPAAMLACCLFIRGSSPLEG